MHRAHRIPAIVAFALAASSLSACATQVVETTSTTAVGAATTTTTLPSGPPAELLPQLVVTLQQVAEAIIDESDQKALLATAEGLWTASKPTVESTDAEAAAEMEGMMDLARGAVQRNRPADADKAAKFLGLLVDHYLDS